MKHFKTPARGIMFARADAAPTVIFAELQAAFAQFKETHAEEIKGMKAKFDDVVTRDKLEKINAQVGDLQSALDAANLKMAAMSVGTGDGRQVKDGEYSTAFAAHMRKGDVQASLNKGAADEGGYLAPTEWDRTITDKLVNVSPMRQLATVVTTSKAAFSKLFNLRGTGSGWVGETAARPETGTPEFGPVTYTPMELYANAAATQGMLDDAEINLEAWLAGEIETEFAAKEGAAFVSGNAATQPKGFLTYVTGGTNAAAHPFGAIGLINSGAAAGLTADGLIDLVYALPSQFEANAGWTMNKKTLGAVRKLRDGDGRYLWQPSYVAGQPSTVLGYGVTEMPDMPDLAASSKSIAFGDFKAGYLIVDRIGTRVLRDPYSNKPYVMFYVTKRVGGGLLNPEAIKVLNTAVNA